MKDEDGKEIVKNEFCICNIKVAPHDPDKVERNGRRFHRKCLEKAGTLAQQKKVAGQQSSFGFTDYVI
jgi:hypothetical protein